MVVDAKDPAAIPSLSGAGDAKSGRERVSGIDSFFGSSEGSHQEELSSGAAGQTSSLQDQLQRAKAKVGGAWECKSPAKSPRASRDVPKAGRYTPYKKMTRPEALAKSIQTMQKGELGALTSVPESKNAKEGDVQGDTETRSNLVGAHGEPH
jgi:hypothetical protein